MVPTLWKHNQEMQTEIDDLKKLIKDLTARVEALEVH